MQVDQHTTPESMRDVRRALVRAWRKRMRSPVPLPVLALMLALVDLETATGESMHNHNLGNMIAVSEQQPFFVGDDSGNVRRFRAFPSLDAGALAIVRQLLSESRPNWRRGLLTGDPVLFSRGLKQDGYYEAPESRYTRTLVERWRRYAPANASVTDGGSVLPLVLGAVAAGGLVLAGVMR